MNYFLFILLFTKIISANRPDDFQLRSSDNSKLKKKSTIGKYIVTYYVDHSLSLSHINLGLMLISEVTCIKFRKTLTHRKAKLVFLPGYYYSSEFGCNKNLQRKIKIPRKKIYHVKVARETMHALGVEYEIHRPDRDLYVEILTCNVIPLQMPLFKMKDSFSSPNYNENYDYNSIMHFSKNEYSVNKMKSIEAKDKLMEKTMGYAKQLSFNDAKTLNYKFCINHENPLPRCANYGYPSPINNKMCLCLPFFIGYTCNILKSNHNSCLNPNVINVDRTAQNIELTLDENCVFVLVSQNKKKIQVDFMFLQTRFYYRECTDEHHVEIRYRQDFSVSGLIYCPTHKPLSLKSQGDKIFIRSDYPSGQYKLLLKYQEIY